MNIRILAILLAAGAAANPSAAQTISRDEASLPQFMSSTARAELQRSRRNANPEAPGVRQAAEELSARFSDVATGAPATSSGATADQPAIAGRRAVLVAGSSPIVTGSTDVDPKNRSVAQPATAPKAKKRIAEHQGHSKHAVVSHREHYGTQQQPHSYAPNALPGAGTGWKTGLIGFLTNPAFWHSEPVTQPVGFQ